MKKCKPIILTAAVAAIALAAASPAHADQATIDAAVHDSWQYTCQSFTAFTGNPANDAAVLMAAIRNLESMYAMDPHDASQATGRIIAQDCPQYKANIDALQKWANS